MRYLKIAVRGKTGASSFMVAINSWVCGRAISLLVWASLASITGVLNASPLYYYDGGVKKAVEIEPEQWASTKKGAAGLRVEIRQGSAVEKSALSSTSNLATKSEKAALKAMPGSPVFRSADGGTPMVLPGGVIVKQKLGSDSAEKLLKSKGLEIERAFADSNTFLVKSPEGISSLELANQLHESGDFESASPNWWRERRKK
jgi:hypothetical protein